MYNNNNNNLVSGMMKNNSQVQVADAASMINSQLEFFKTYYNDENSTRQGMETAIAIANDPKFANCTPESVVKAIMDSIRLGLDATSGINHTWLVPYRNSVQLQISAKGYMQLLYRAGWLINVEAIYEGDHYIHSYDQNGLILDFKPDHFNRKTNDKKWIQDNFNGVYVCATDPKGRKIVNTVSANEIEKLRLSSPGQTKTGEYTKPREKQRIEQGLPVDIWESWYEEMALAKAIKQTAKRLPIESKTVLKAIKLDDYAEAGKEAEYAHISSTLSSNDKLEAIEANIAPAAEPQPSPEEKIENTPSFKQLKSSIRSLGYVPSMVEGNNKGQYFIKITKDPSRYDQNLSRLSRITGIAKHKDFFVLNVTHYMNGEAA